MTNEAILQKLQELTQGLYYISESDYPMEVVHFDDVEADNLSDEAISQLAGQPTDAKVETVDLAYFLRNMTRTEPEADEAEGQNAERFQALQALMEQQLSGVKVYRIGRREITALALGALPEGGYGGFKTILIET
ncbi:nuclease A inhibitor family protein [Pontibacter toksunensis]|uniref:Nuclease A inhibitor family protein n=1 Tax=Pontibacter toksunensis TaxID=1332631 RepID=A0ABW6BU91_9BACT